MINMKVKALGEKFGSQRSQLLDVKDEEPRWEEERKTAEDQEKKKKNGRKGLKFRRDGF